MNHNIKKHIKRNLITIAICSTFISGNLIASEVDEEEKKTEEAMENIIVTGSVRGHTALETSYGVSVVGSEDVDKLASIGTAAVPGAGIIMLVIILEAINVPSQGIALILGVDRILDMIRTTTNVTGDATIACAMDSLEK